MGKFPIKYNIWDYQSAKRRCQCFCSDLGGVPGCFGTPHLISHVLYLTWLSPACCLLIAVFKNDTKLDMSRCCWSKTSFIHNETEWSRSMRHFRMCIFILRVLKSSQLKAQPSKGCYNVRNYQLNMPPYFLRDLPLLHLPKWLGRSRFF